MNRRLAALDFITSCLSVHSSSDINCALRSTIASGHLDWTAVIEIANIQLVTPALWVALRNRGLVEDLPADVCQYLQELHRLNTVRNEHLKAQLIEVVTQLNVIGIEPLLLKGSVSFFINTYDDPGSRVMTDLDILVPKESARECWDLLRHTLGYSPEIPPKFDEARCQHLIPLFRHSDYATVEIHREALSEETTGGLLPTQLIWEHAQLIKEAGLILKVPMPTHRFVINLLHSSLHHKDYRFGEISLRSFHELAIIQSTCQEHIDRKSIQQLLNRGGAAKALNASLYLYHRLFGSPLPDGFRPTLGALTHYARSRLQVRWNWTGDIINRVLHFSAQDIAERYGCDGSFLSLTRGRMRYIAYLSDKYSKQLLGSVRRQL